MQPCASDSKVNINMSGVFIHICRSNKYRLANVFSYQLAYGVYLLMGAVQIITRRVGKQIS